MNKYQMLPADTSVSREELIAMYNNAVETIWAVEQRCAELHKDYDNLLESYEEVADQLYG